MFSKFISNLGRVIEERPIKFSMMTLMVALREMDDKKQVTLSFKTSGQSTTYRLDKEHVDGLIIALEQLRGGDV